MTTKKQIDDFLALKRIAFVGVSHNPREFSYALWQEFRQRRYQAIPVNPIVATLDGQDCYKRVQEIKPAVDGVLIMTSSKATEQIVHDCAEAGVKHVWMYKGVASGAVNKAAVDDPALLTALADEFGAQAVVCAIDARGGEVVTHGGREARGLDAVEWAQAAVGRGAGEILLT